MWRKLLCWVIGHRLMVKAFTGNTVKGTNPLTGQSDDVILLYRWQREPRCIRCGKTIPE